YSAPNHPSPADALLLVRCEPGLTCSPYSETCVNVCERGARCASDFQCGEDTGLVCVRLPEDGGSGFCDNPRTAGERCGADDDCDAAFDCVYDVDADASFCQPKLANGEPCLNDGQ